MSSEFEDYFQGFKTIHDKVNQERSYQGGYGNAVNKEVLDLVPAATKMIPLQPN